MHQILRGYQIDFSTAITGSTGTSQYPGWSMADATEIAWVPIISGTPSTDGSSINAQECSSSGFTTGSDVSDLTGTSVALSSSITGGFAVIDIYKPKKQWVRMEHVKLSTADILSGVIVIRRRNDLPVTHSTSFSHGVEYFNSPSTGTA